LKPAVTLVSRLIAVFLAFIASCITAGVVITIGILVNESEDLFAFADPSVIWWMAGFFVFMVTSVAMLPGIAMIALAEWSGVRSVLVYAAAGGLGLVAFYYGFGYANRTGALSGLREAEIMAGAGIAAGFVYWAIAGRNAGAWRKLPLT
jgi:hypothetical protein